jgi:hypothetical protein
MDRMDRRWKSKAESPRAPQPHRFSLLYTVRDFDAVERQCDVTGLSSADDVCWVAEGMDVGEVTSKPERAAGAAME